MLNERKLTERELDVRKQAVKGLMSNKRTLVQKYGKDAEKVMYGIATKQAKKKIEDMNLDNLKELIKKSLQHEETTPSVPNASTDVTKTVDTGFSGRADYGEEDKALGREDELEMRGLEEGHGLDQDDLDYLKDRVQPGGPIRGRLKKIIDFIIKSNILQDKTKDLSKGKVNENIEEFEVDDAVVELRRIVDEIEEKADEARDIVRDIFPNELSRLDGYGAFNAMYSANRYDTTLGKFVDRLEEEGYDIEDGIVYVNEEVSSANFAKGIDVIKSTLSKEGGAAGLEPLVKELVKLGFKKDEVIDLLSKMTSVKKHRDGDYILLPLEEKELSKSEQNSLKKIEKALRKASKSHKSQSSDLAKSTKAHKLQADKIAKIVREKLSKKNDVGDFVDDFKKSKAKQFRGKSSKKKKEMAVAAYLAKQND